METHTHHHDNDVHTPEEALVLLKYMFGHNTEHTAELDESAQMFGDGEISALIKSAVECYEKGNALLDEAIRKAEG